jgi:hypothetical protein
VVCSGWIFAADEVDAVYARVDELACRCLDFQNISFLSLCSFLGPAALAEDMAVCGREPSESVGRGPNVPPMSCDKLWMLARFRRREEVTLGSCELELTDGVRLPLTSRRDKFACSMLSIVERLLVREGTSSTEPRTSCEFSTVVYELIVRLSAIEDADVPTRDVSNELCRRPRSGDESAEELCVSGVVSGI